MKKLIQILKESIKEKAIAGRTGAYLSHYDMRVIIDSLAESRLVSRMVLSQLKRKENLSDLMIANISKIIQSLKMNGRKHLNSSSLSHLMDTLKRVESGDAQFIDTSYDPEAV